MRKVGVLVVAVLALLGLTAQALAAYPSPTPDFSHPGSPHADRPLFSPVGGQADRAVLVIYIRYSDVDYPAGFDAARISERFFGTGGPITTTFPSVVDYFKRLSYDDLFLFPALESDGAQDGVVSVEYPGTRAEFSATPLTERNRRVLQLADPFFDYSYYDVDGNGRLDNTEIVVNLLEIDTGAEPFDGCGIARGTDPVTLDGTSLGTLLLPLVGHSTNLITIIHENAHALTHMADLYGFGAGRLDVAGPTCKLPDSALIAPNAWTKMHLGWITPTVVTADGYYDVREANTSGDAFILYDPERGTDDYFLVENRQRMVGTYDRGAADSGLVIWRVNDSSLGVDNGLRPIEPILPSGLQAPADYGGADTDAWDALDPRTPQRVMAEPWADGSTSRVAVRAIGRTGATMRPYFDVVGPGLLVDTYSIDNNSVVGVVAGSSRQIDVDIMNTGENGCDTYAFEPTELPAGWTTGRGSRILCAKEQGLARMSFAPPAGATPGFVRIQVQGWSVTDPSIVTTAPLLVRVWSASDSIGGVAGDLTTMIDTATANQRVGLLAARDDLIGNNAGASTNGALDALEAGDEVAAVTKLGSATANLLTARTRGVDTTNQVESLASTTESVANTEYAKAQDARPGATKELARIAALIEAGRAAVRAGDHTGAQSSFKQAVSKATTLQR